MVTGGYKILHKTSKTQKNLGLSVEEKRMSIEPTHPQISVSHQCELLGLARSSFYYEPQCNDPYNELLMRLIDEQYARTTFYSMESDV